MTRNGNNAQALFVSGVCCSTEETVVRKQLNALAGPDGYVFNAVTCELRLHDATKNQQAIQILTRSGFPTRSKKEIDQPQSFRERHGHAVLTGTAAILAIIGIAGERMGVSVGIVQTVLISSILVGGWRVFVKAWKSARTYVLDMNVLMSIAVIGALCIGKFGEGAAVIVLFAVSLMLESYSSARTRRALHSLMTLSPEQACVVGDGSEMVVPAESVLPGQHVLIRPGERIPIDGVVLEGNSLVNQSAITGEATPLVATAGVHVFAGSMNNQGSILVKATSRYEETAIARIIHLVEEAQLERAPVQNLVDRFARVYTPVILGLAIAVALIPPLILHEPLSEWFYRSLVLLVIACPCALVISTPVTIVSALTRAARLGILIKGGRHIETLSNLQAIAFDKTGTLTHGQPMITDIVPLNSIPDDRILQIAAALEHRSEHPLASAIIREAGQRSIDYSLLPVDEFIALPGFGVSARVEGIEYFLGNRALCEQKGFCSPVVEQEVDRLENEGKTAVVLSSGSEALSVLAIRDTARDQSSRAISELKSLGVKRAVLVSGDHGIAAREMADDVGIEESRGALLPEDKIKVIEQLKRDYGTVAMVGDGVNDAPALAAASVGIAMGGTGTDTAMETADVVFMADDLSKLPLLIRLSRNTTRIIRQNIAIALSLKLAFLVLSVAGVTTLWMAVLADDGAALIVILNGLRVLSFKDSA